MTSLEQRIAELSLPLEPQPTSTEPQLPRLEGIRAVVFDIYGTVLISGCGEISMASEGARGEAAEAAFATLGLETTIAGDEIVEYLHEAIRQSHMDSLAKNPEVEIRDIWRTVLKQLGLTLDTGAIERLAVEYECRVNPIWPMPGLAETFVALREAGVALGIVSNAQFFTPMAFVPITGKSLADWGFDPGLSVWSYEHREAKPGVFLYERCVEGLKARGIAPNETLFVGNDLRNDIWPAQQVGMRGALFAGDARSLRLREDDTEVAQIRPDAIVTDLRQLLKIVL